ncbi:hypothetical protein LPJ75_002279 [Coemansia sp. RSA 2598]|nr:hypothetical protein LPJ75_002279 [Coemansia sp. RSA 2598]
MPLLTAFDRTSRLTLDKAHAHAGPYSSVQSSETAASSDCSFETQLDEAAAEAIYDAESDSDAGTLESFACEFDQYCAELDKYREHFVSVEKACVPAFSKGPFWSMKRSFELRADMFDWLSLVTTQNEFGLHVLYMSVQHLDRFLSDFHWRIEAAHLKAYAYACLVYAAGSLECRSALPLKVPRNDAEMLGSDYLDAAMNQVAQTLAWCIDVEMEESELVITRLVKLPTMFDYLFLAFQRAAIEVPRVFADPEHRQHEIGPEHLSCIEFDMDPFSKACDFASALLRDHECLPYRTSALAAACFYLAVRHEGFDDIFFEECTGYSFESAQSAIFFAFVVCELEY